MAKLFRSVRAACSLGDNSSTRWRWMHYHHI